VFFGEIDMLGYATIGTKNLETSCAFYDALLAGIGGKQLMVLDHIKFYGTDAGSAMLAIASPYNGEAQHCGNGNMIAIPSGSTEGADALYAKANELGATDDGIPGQRLPFFYGAYVRDLDGNKLCFFHMTAV
jgi:predicted lactoylglutathione lyase